MMRRGPAPAAFLALLVALAPAPCGDSVGATAEAPREAHGGFAGEIKPVLYVTDVEASAPFYRDTLGFAFEGFAGKEDDPYYAEMVAATVKFGLHEPTSEEQDSKIGRQRLYFRVRDLLAHHARVTARGGEPGKIRTTGWMDMFIVRDPDGNEIVFAVTDPERHTSNPWSTEGSVGRPSGEAP